MGGSCCETGGVATLDQVRVAGEVVTRVHLALAGQNGGTEDWHCDVR